MNCLLKPKYQHLLKEYNIIERLTPENIYKLINIYTSITYIKIISKVLLSRRIITIKSTKDLRFDSPKPRSLNSTEILKSKRKQQEIYEAKEVTHH